MTDSTKSTAEYSSIYRQQPFFADKPFDSSAFDLGPFAERVTAACDALSHGAVIAINAPWGHGKTYFGRNLDAQLRADGWKTVYVDAFAHDYIEDPFLLLASLIKEQAATKPKKTGFVKAASAVGKTLLPTTAKAAAKIATGGLVSGETLEEVDKALADAAGDAAFKVIESRIADFEKDRTSIEAFRARLSELAQDVYSQTVHPLVVFLDELDRCRPDFAVRTLERLKHFFDVPYLIFVLLLNKAQLQGAVNGIYGASLDAETYLRKFIHITFDLPIRGSLKDERESELREYPSHLAERVNLGENQRLLQPFTQTLSELAGTMSLSFRDVERCLTEFVVVALKAKIAADLIPHLTFIIVLKVMRPDLLERLVRRDVHARKDIGDLLSAAHTRGLGDWLVQTFDAMVTGHVGVKVSPEMAEHLRQFLFRFNLSADNMFRILANLVDPRFAH